MEMREFGGTGIRASVIGLGCNNFGIYQDAGQAIAVVRKALDVGINFLDMAKLPTILAQSPKANTARPRALELGDAATQLHWSGLRLSPCSSQLAMAKRY
jgi:hypothetical protein